MSDPARSTAGAIPEGRISVDARLASLDAVRKRHPGAAVIDVTARGPEPWVRFSPFYPQREIPIPGLPGRVAATVEGIWQGLKVFEHEDVDPSLFESASMRGLKRGGAARGKVTGHRWGEGEGSELLGYIAARRRIYLPAYRFVLEARLGAELEELARIAEAREVVLLDFATNPDVADARRPLSHAALVRLHLEGNWPAEE